MQHALKTIATTNGVEQVAHVKEESSQGVVGLAGAHRQRQVVGTDGHPARTGLQVDFEVGRGRGRAAHQLLAIVSLHF